MGVAADIVRSAKKVIGGVLELSCTLLNHHQKRKALGARKISPSNSLMHFFCVTSQDFIPSHFRYARGSPRGCAGVREICGPLRAPRTVDHGARTWLPLSCPILRDNVWETLTFS